MATLFLELDDEITSAVARLRDGGEQNVALVLPAGSRIASGRINFRLLAREAETLGARLAIVSPEATARALAASAGLPAYESVRRYEAAMDGLGGSEDGAAVAGGPSPGGGTGGREAEAIAGPSVADGGLPAGAASGASAGSPFARQADLPVVRSEGRGSRIRIPGRTVVAGVLIVALLGSGSAAGAYLVLPEARVVVTPRVETFGPLVMEMRADPDATGADPDAGLVPARMLEMAFEESDTFAATGIKVTETRATGNVTFSNLDPTADGAVSIPERSVVRTKGGLAFRTRSDVVVPRAQLDGTTIIPSTRSVAILAVDRGTGGNVGANTITVIPNGYDSDFLKVTNPQATSGGTRVETKVVLQSDYDSAVTELSDRIGGSFDAWLAATIAELGEAVVMADSAMLDEPLVDLPAADLVGAELDEFQLVAQASARVVTFDPATLLPLGEARFRATEIPAGYVLIEDSVEVRYRELESDDPARPRYEVTAAGRGYRELDGAELESLILGTPLAEAAAILRPYGDAVISLEPDWFGTIPQLDWRVSVEIRTPSEAS